MVPLVVMVLVVVGKEAEEEVVAVCELAVIIAVAVGRAVDIIVIVAIPSHILKTMRMRMRMTNTLRVGAMMQGMTMLWLKLLKMVLVVVGQRVSSVVVVVSVVLEVLIVGEYTNKACHRHVAAASWRTRGGSEQS